MTEMMCQLTIDDFKGDCKTFYTKVIDNKIDVTTLKIEYNRTLYTPLHLAVKLDNYEILFILHFCFKCKINVKISNGMTPLHTSVFNEHNGITSYLLLNGAIVDSHDDTGATPLYYACLEKQYNTAVLLKEYGADVYIKDKDGDSPRKLIGDNGWNFLSFRFSNIKDMEYFPQTRNWYNRMIETYF